ncbi:MAG: ABC transporter substrate-binding protein [Ornithinimicrobium sp.]
MTRTTVGAAALLAGFAVAACGGSTGPGPDTGDDSSAAESLDGARVTVGSANFPENILLAEIYTSALEAEGVEVRQRLSLGSRETYLAGLEEGSISVVPEYTGALALHFNPDVEASDPDGVFAELEEALPPTLIVLEPSQAQDQDCLVVTQETAREFGLTTIADLEPVADSLVLGGAPQFEDRPSGVPGLREVYGLEFSAYRPLAAGSDLAVRSLANGQVDVANIFSTDPSIKENDFVVLEDPESLFVAQNVVPLMNKEANNDRVSTTLNKVSATLDTPLLTELLAQVVVHDADPKDVAQTFVEEDLGWPR